MSEAIWKNEKKLLEIKVRESRQGNQTWTIQRNQQQQGRQDEDKQNKNTIGIRHHYTQTNTNNVNKT